MANAQAKYVIKLEDKTKRAFKAIGKSLKRTTSAVFSMKTGFVSAAGIAGIGYFVKKSLDATDDLGKMSRAIGVSVENLSRLRHAASLGGLEATQLDKAVQKLAVNMADMSKGVGLAKDVFEKYNIEVENSDGTLRDVVDVMADVADVTAGLTNKTEKADLAYKLFGARGGKMINVLEGGSAAMHEAMLEADKLGITMTESMVKGAEDTNDAITRLSKQLTSTFNVAVAKLAPLITKIVDGLREWATTKIDEHGGIARLATSIANTVIKASINIVIAIQDVANAVFDLGRQFEQLPFMGHRSIKEIQKDIDDLNKSMKEGNLLDGLFGDNLAEWNELNKELEDAKSSFTGIGKVDFSANVHGLESMLIPMGQIEEESKKLKDSFKDLTGAGDGGGDKKKTTEKTIWDKMKAGFEDYKDTVGKGTLSIASITKKTMQSTEDAIVNMMMGVKTDFKSLARSIIADLIRIQVRKKMVAAFDTGSSISKFFGGFFANGGRPPVGRPSIVGERGAELFVPDTAGTIIPTDQLGGGQTVIVNYSPQVNSLDPRTASAVIAENAPTIVGVIRQAFNRNGRSVPL